MKKIDPAEARAAVLEIADWIRDPDAVDRPSRAAIARAVRLTAYALAQEAPGHTVELRIPPFAAVQCISGPRHTRGTPPNVVEADAPAWLRVATGGESFAAAVAAGNIESSGSRAGEIARHLPVVRLGSRGD